MQKFFESWSLKMIAAMAVVGTGTLASMGNAVGGDPFEQKIFVLTSDEDDDDDDVHERKGLHAVVEVAHAPKLWLGIMLKDVEGDLARYLDSDEGILVDSVIDESPADKAGIKEGDVLLSVGETNLTAPSALLKVMAGLKEDGESLELILIRKGEKQTVKVTPVERPEMEEVVVENLEDLHLELKDAEEAGEAVERVLKRLRIGDKDMNILRFGSPSMIFRGRDKTATIEGNVEAVIVRENDGEKIEVKVIRKDDKPATVTVTKDGEVTEFTEDNLDELPEEIAVIVEPMIDGKQRIRIGGVVGPGGIVGRNWTELEIGDLDGDEIRKKAREMAEKTRAAASEAVERARQRTRLRKNDAPDEVSELKAMVEELRTEIEKLKVELKDKE